MDIKHFRRDGRGSSCFFELGKEEQQIFQLERDLNPKQSKHQAMANVPSVANEVQFSCQWLNNSYFQVPIVTSKMPSKYSILPSWIQNGFIENR